jgi:hypothetical protein
LCLKNVNCHRIVNSCLNFLDKQEEDLWTNEYCVRIYPLSILSDFIIIYILVLDNIYIYTRHRSVVSLKSQKLCYFE